MSTANLFAHTENDILNSVFEFYSKPEFYREVLRSSPKYFVHIKNGTEHIFGLSKFCAFKNITVQKYISTYRYKTRGGVTQKYISNLTGKNWTARNKISKDVRNAFDNWISEFFPNYSLNNASFITLTSEIKIKRQNKFISPEDLLKKLEIQKKIGKIGEEIAYRFELKRLKEIGIKNPSEHIEHVSLKNSASGYDIYSSIKNETRYIEVKTSLKNNSEFFMSENEVKTLDELENEAYLYLVHIIDLNDKLGSVYKVYKNPINYLKKNGFFEPVMYRVKDLK